MQNFFPDPVEQNVTLYGRTAEGLPLTERSLWSGEKSLLLITGFCPADRALSQETEAWIRDLEGAEKRGDSFLGFDLKFLKKKGKIRLVSKVDPSIDKIYRNGINKSDKNIDTNAFSENTSYNRRGVDLYRNFGSDWLKLHRDPLHKLHCGPFPESETEVAALTSRVRKDPPHAALILRRGTRGLFYPLQATEEEIREARFLARFASISLFPCRDAEGTVLQWLTDRGIKALELREEEGSPFYLQKLLTMCVALL